MTGVNDGFWNDDSLETGSNVCPNLNNGHGSHAIHDISEID